MQKTAYEMRISDLSSYVCSSDLSTLTQRRASKEPVDKGGWNVFITNGTIAGIANPLIHTFSKNCDQAWYGWPCEPQIVELSRKWALESDPAKAKALVDQIQTRSEAHTSDLQSLMRISYAVLCLKKKNTTHTNHIHINSS